ncbi:MAG TPA: 50S ribosomal protein L34e [archaeon]|nr:50S ribosomal protein L34e [archaeon]
MVRRALRSTSYRKLKRVTPGGRAVTHYERRRPALAHCAGCSGELHGVPRLRTARFRAIPHTSRRPERAYGGQLCPACTAERIKLEKLYVHTPMGAAGAPLEAA